MKKIIIALALFATAFANSQNGYNQTTEHYHNIIEQLKGLNKEASKDLADLVIKSVETSYSYIRTSETRKGITYIYEVEKKISERSRKIIPTENIVIRFSEGYDLLEIQGVFEDLMPIWQKYFIGDADKTKVVNDYKYRDLVFEPLGVNYRFEEAKDIWKISIKNK